MIFDDLIQSDSNAFANDVDYSIYESSPEGKYLYIYKYIYSLLLNKGKTFFFT